MFLSQLVGKKKAKTEKAKKKKGAAWPSGHQSAPMGTQYSAPCPVNRGRLLRQWSIAAIRYALIVSE